MFQQSLLLDAKETPVISSPDVSYRAYTQQSHQSEWKSARAAYALLEDIGDLQKLDSFEFCRKVAWFVRHDETGQVRVASQQCHLRWCPMCAQVRQTYISHQVKDWIKGTSYAKFITLTVRSEDQPISEQINHLYDSFKRLRKSKPWRSRITGGVWFFQITLNLKTQMWHPHLHVIAIGKFYSKRKLSADWLSITGDSPIVDIKAVKDKEQAAQYAARYSAKPANLEKMPCAEGAELILAMHGRRICGCWGKGCKIKFRPQKPDDADKWKSVGDFGYVVNLLGSDSHADMIWQCWQDGQALPPDISLLVLEHEIAGLQFLDAPEKPPPVPIDTPTLFDYNL